MLAKTVFQGFRFFQCFHEIQEESGIFGKIKECFWDTFWDNFMAKAPKGTVVVQGFKGRLRLRWSYCGKRYCLYLELPNTSVLSCLPSISRERRTRNSTIFY